MFKQQGPQPFEADDHTERRNDPYGDHSGNIGILVIGKRDRRGPENKRRDNAARYKERNRNDSQRRRIDDLPDEPENRGREC